LSFSGEAFFKIKNFEFYELISILGIDFIETAGCLMFSKNHFPKVQIIKIKNR